MIDPISPISAPHGYYSQIPNAEQLSLTAPLLTQLKVITGRLEQMHTEAGYAYPNASHLAKDFQKLDSDLSSFFAELNKSPNRGYENQVKEKITLLHNQFTKDLDTIKNSDMTSLRDVLYDPQKCEDFLDKLSKTAGGREQLQQIAPLAETFKQQVHATFSF